MNAVKEQASGAETIVPSERLLYADPLLAGLEGLSRKLNSLREARTMNAAKEQARRNAVSALTQALIEVRTYLDCHSTQEERLGMIGLEPDLHELARRFEYETKDEGDGP